MTLSPAERAATSALKLLADDHKHADTATSIEGANSYVGFPAPKCQNDNILIRPTSSTFSGTFPPLWLSTNPTMGSADVDPSGSTFTNIDALTAKNRHDANTSPSSHGTPIFSPSPPSPNKQSLHTDNGIFESQTTNGGAFPVACHPHNVLSPVPRTATVSPLLLLAQPNIRSDSKGSDNKTDTELASSIPEDRESRPPYRPATSPVSVGSTNSYYTDWTPVEPFSPLASPWLSPVAPAPKERTILPAIPQFHQRRAAANKHPYQQIPSPSQYQHCDEHLGKRGPEDLEAEPSLPYSTPNPHKRQRLTEPHESLLIQMNEDAETTSKKLAQNIFCIDPWRWSNFAVCFSLTDRNSIDLQLDTSLVLPPGKDLSIILEASLIDGPKLLTCLHNLALNDIGITRLDHQVSLIYLIKRLRQRSAGYQSWQLLDPHHHDIITNSYSSPRRRNSSFNLSAEPIGVDFNIAAQQVSQHLRHFPLRTGESRGYHFAGGCIEASMVSVDCVQLYYYIGSEELVRQINPFEATV